MKMKQKIGTCVVLGIIAMGQANDTRQGNSNNHLTIAYQYQV